MADIRSSLRKWALTADWSRCNVRSGLRELPVSVTVRKLRRRTGSSINRSSTALNGASNRRLFAECWPCISSGIPIPNEVQHARSRQRRPRPRHPVRGMAIDGIVTAVVLASALVLIVGIGRQHGGALRPPHDRACLARPVPQRLHRIGAPSPSAHAAIALADAEPPLPGRCLRRIAPRPCAGDRGLFRAMPMRSYASQQPSAICSRHRLCLHPRHGGYVVPRPGAHDRTTAWRWLHWVGGYYIWFAFAKFLCPRALHDGFYYPSPRRCVSLGLAPCLRRSGRHAPISEPVAVREIAEHRRGDAAQSPMIASTPRAPAHGQVGDVHAVDAGDEGQRQEVIAMIEMISERLSICSLRRSVSASCISEARSRIDSTSSVIRAARSARRRGGDDRPRRATRGQRRQLFERGALRD